MVSIPADASACKHLMTVVLKRYFFGDGERWSAVPRLATNHPGRRSEQDLLPFLMELWPDFFKKSSPCMKLPQKYPCKAKNERSEA